MRRNTFLSAGALLGAIALGVFLVISVSRASAQNDQILELRARLEMQQVPIKEIFISNQSPLQVVVRIQSASSGAQGTPNDPLFSAIVQREILASFRRGFEIQAYRVEVMNTDGQTIGGMDVPIDENLAKEQVIPSEMDDSLIAQTIREQLPVGDLSLQQLEVSKDEDGAHVLFVELVAPDIEIANKEIPELMNSLSRQVEKLRNVNGLRLASYRVDIYDAQGEPLLKYVKDYLTTDERANWWQAPGITQGWFPHPLSTLAPQIDP